MNHDSRRGKVDDLIDANLRNVYDSILKEEVPARFTELLAQLEARESDAPAAREEALCGGGSGSGSARESGPE